MAVRVKLFYVKVQPEIVYCSRKCAKEDGQEPEAMETLSPEQLQALWPALLGRGDTTCPMCEGLL